MQTDLKLYAFWDPKIKPAIILNIIYYFYRQILNGILQIKLIKNEKDCRRFDTPNSDF